MSPRADAAGGLPNAGIITARRRALPGSRAVLGGFLVAAAAVIVFAAVLGRSGSHDASFVVATRVLPAGAAIGPGDVSTAPAGVSGSARAQLFSAPSQLIGRQLAVAVEPGELVEASMLSPAGGPGLRPVDISVAPDSLLGLTAGEPVDVLAATGSGADDGTGTDGSATAGSGSPAGGTSVVSVVVRGAVLLDVDQPSSGLLSGSDTDVVTLGVADLDEVEAVVAADQGGTAVLVRAEPADGTGLGPGPGG